MMKFWKSKEEKRAKAAASRQHVLDELAGQFETIMQTPDVSERLEKLAALHDAVKGVETVYRTAIRSTAAEKIYLPYAGITFGAVSVAGTIVLAAALSPAFIAVPLLPAIIAGLHLGEKRSAAFRVRQEQELQPFFDGLAQRQSLISEAAAETVTKNIRELAVSEKFEALQAMPGLRAHFMAALKKSLTEPVSPAHTPKKDKSGFKI